MQRFDSARRLVRLRPRFVIDQRCPKEGDLGLVRHLDFYGHIVVPDDLAFDRGAIDEVKLQRGLAAAVLYEFDLTGRNLFLTVGFTPFGFK
jgi:hypothetical protein